MIEAQFPGSCPAGDPIHPGQLIEDTADGWRHVDCAEPAEPAPTPVCPECFTARSLAGTCSCTT